MAQLIDDEEVADCVAIRHCVYILTVLCNQYGHSTILISVHTTFFAITPML